MHAYMHKCDHIYIYIYTYIYSYVHAHMRLYNKVAAAVYNHAVKPVVTTSACYTQRGFVAGRQHVQNVVDLDTEARLGGLAAALYHLAVLIFLDFAAAFPSVLHEWLVRISEANGTPIGFRMVIRAMYFLNSAWVMSDASVEFAFWILSGVLQGCPLSGTFVRLRARPISQTNRWNH